MKRIIHALVGGFGLALALAGASFAEDPSGDWLGAITVGPGVVFHEAVHIKKTPQGGYAGALDSLDRAAFGIPLGDIAADGDTLSFTAATRPAATYTARWDAASGQWVGQWTQSGQTFPLILARGVAAPKPVVSGLDGSWDGVLGVGTTSLHLTLHVLTGAGGTAVWLDSPDQLAYGLAVNSIERDGANVRFALTAPLASFAGALSADQQSLAGQWTQGGNAAPLSFIRRAPGAQPAWNTPSDADIRALLAHRIDAGYRGIAMVVGVIDASGRRIMADGVRSAADPRPPDGDTVFEIGSITKSFTGLVLADMIDKGEVGLDDPVAKYLPAGVVVPSHGGKQITLADLVTNTSGLPDNPADVAAVRPADPYAGYQASTAQLFELLKQIQLGRDPGAQPSHSNLGVGLLGVALARRAGQSYAALVESRITRPLGMASTAVAPSPSMRARRLAGHGVYLLPAPDIQLGDLAGAGALNSTANDMLGFLAAELGFADSPLQQAMATQISAIRRPNGGGYDMALEMIVSHAGSLVLTNGGTFGFQSFLGFDAKRRVGVVVLANVGQGSGPRVTDDIGMHILTGSAVASLPAPSPAPTAIVLPAEALEHYVGRYELGPRASITVTRDGDHLFAQLTGQPSFEIFPGSSTSFFWKLVDAQLSFVVGPDGQVTGAVLHQDGRNSPAPRSP